MKFCAFDLEIARPFSAGRPFGISCAAAAVWDGETYEVKTWYPGAGFAPAGEALYPQMVPAEVQEMASFLIDLQVPIVTWNGLGFDFRTVAEECEDWADDVKTLALGHIDIGFQMVCQMGYMIKLSVAAAALGAGGKTEGVQGDLAPFMWNGFGIGETSDIRVLAEERLAPLGIKPGSRMAQDMCLQYVRQDAILTGNVYRALLPRKGFRWITAKGRLSWKPWEPVKKEGQLLTCREARELPAVDVSWMTEPRSRESYYEWV